MRLDHCHRHDVEDAAGVRVFQIGQLLVTSTPVIGRLNLAVDLTAISTFEEDAVFAMCGYGGADGRVKRLFLGDLFDVKRFLIADVELSPNLVNHVLDGNLLGRRASTCPTFAWP